MVKLSELAIGHVEFETTARKLFDAPGQAAAWAASGPIGQAGRSTWWRRSTPTTIRDLKDGIIEVQLDGEAPPTPTNLRVKGGNEALSVSWDPIERSAVDDMQGYVLFCSRDDQPVFVGKDEEPAFDPPYETVQTAVPGRRQPPSACRCWRPAQTAQTGAAAGARRDDGAGARAVRRAPQGLSPARTC